LKNISYQIQFIGFGDLEAEFQMGRQQHYLPDHQLWTQKIILMDVAQHLAESFRAGSHWLSIYPYIPRHSSGTKEKAKKNQTNKE